MASLSWHYAWSGEGKLHAFTHDAATSPICGGVGAPILDGPALECLRDAIPDASRCPRCVSRSATHSAPTEEAPVPETSPSPVDLDFLSERARAYVVGLEARNKSLREELAKARDELADPSTVDARVRDRLAREYRRGRDDAALRFSAAARDAESALRRLRAAAVRTYTEGALSTHTADTDGGGDE